MEKSRAVAYVRVSTASDAQLHSFEFQEQYWKNAFADDPTTELVGFYADKGISGCSIERRPQFLCMMQDARDHKFDKIYTKSVSRFARNTEQLLEAVRELRDIGVEVVFEKENIHTFQPTSEVFLTIAATIAENDLKVDSERQIWSIRHRYENGWIFIGTGLYGLKMTPDNELEIVPEEAAIIRFIYSEYLNGEGCCLIARKLNEAGIRTREDREWTEHHVLALLKNEKYKGDVMMGKSLKRGGKSLNNMNGEYAPRYYMEDTHEAIVSKEDWQRAQDIMAERGKNHCREVITHTFTGMIKCGYCGRNFMHKINNCTFKWKTDIWACSEKLRNGCAACGNSSIKDTVLKEKFVEAYNEFIKTRPQGETVIALQEVLADMRVQERELAELHMQRLIPAEAYEAERKTLLGQIAAINEKISEQRVKHVTESDYTEIKEFSAEKAHKFLSKVIVEDYTVTFVFYNGAKISRQYTNGQPGNKKGWNKKEEA